MNPILDQEDQPSKRSRLALVALIAALVTLILIIYLAASIPTTFEVNSGIPWQVNYLPFVIFLINVLACIFSFLSFRKKDQPNWMKWTAAIINFGVLVYIIAANIFAQSI